MSSIKQVGEVDPRKYYLLVYNIQKSFSPLLHNTGFKVLGLPHEYGLFEVPEVDDNVEKLLQDENLGGLSVTAPHKLQVSHLLDTLSDDAQAMLSVNTIVVKWSSTGRRTLHGENTDWEGILRCIVRSQVHVAGAAGVVVGAGGAARAAIFAMIKLDVSPIYVVNRTEDRANELAKTFPQCDIRVRKSLTDLRRSKDVSYKVIVGCVPAISITQEDVPAEFFARVDEGVLVEMAYHTESALVLAAQRAIGWKSFDGIDVLQQQAFGQFTMWTGHPAPERVMMEAVDFKLGRATNPLLV